MAICAFRRSVPSSVVAHFVGRPFPASAASSERLMFSIAFASRRALAAAMTSLSTESVLLGNDSDGVVVSSFADFVTGRDDCEAVGVSLQPTAAAKVRVQKKRNAGFHLSVLG